MNDSFCMLHIREYDFITESNVFLSYASIGVRWYQVRWYQVHLRGWPSPSGVLKHQLYAYSHPSLSLEAKWRKLRCSQNSPWPLILLSMILDGANKAIWCPVTSHLVFELPATDFSNMSGIFVETIWKHKICFKLWEAALHEDTSTCSLLPRCYFHACYPSSGKFQSCHLSCYFLAM